MLQPVVSILVISLCLLNTAWTDITSPVNSTSQYRLPSAISPKHYILKIITNLDESHFSFEGQVWIKILCEKATDAIYLHANKLNITSELTEVKRVVNSSQLNNITVKEQIKEPENEFYIIKLDEHLREGETYIVYLSFAGKLTESLAGYYRSSYKDRASNTTRWLAVTQFEATDARRAFPCFDEPAMKARFTISLGHKENLKSASNMPLDKTEPMIERPGWVWDHFEDTVPMSTYLVAFMVCDFEYRTSEKMANNVTFRVWARKDAIEQVNFARTVGPKFLSYFEIYFNVKYPLPKQDMVAIPDFSAGAMENWGLITYRETALLFDRKSSSNASQYNIATVIAHELAHQWFGNLVTMKWWTDLWLNEGFATYVANIGVHKIFPEWNSLASATVDGILTVFSLDALESSHQVSVPVGNPSEISQIFDSISYKKGAYLLRMMNLFLGEDVFKEGVSNYLKKYKYRNAEQDDLWESLTNSAHVNSALPADMSVKEIMDTWTLQTGYPVVTVTRNYDKKTATLAQDRYLAVKNNSVHGCWWIPITYTTESAANFNETVPKHWLNCKENETTLNIDAGSDEWIIFNIQSAGLYRVNYDLDNWRKIADKLNSDKHKEIDVLNKVQILADSLDFAWGGEIGYDLAFRIVNYLRHEDEHLPWKSALTNLINIERLIRRTGQYGVFKKYMRSLLTPAFKKIGNMKQVPATFEGVKHQNLLVSWSCRYEVDDCLQQAAELFSSWQRENDPDNNNPIPSDLRGIVYSLGVKNGGEQTWDFMWQRYRKANLGSEQSIILSALAWSREVWILNRYLDWSLDESSGIRRQDSVLVFVSIARTDIGFYLAKDYFYRNIKKIHKFYSGGSNRLGKYFNSLTDQMIGEDDIKELEEFGVKNKDYLKSFQRSFRQGVETVVANTRWYQKYYDNIMHIVSTPPEL